MARVTVEDCLDKIPNRFSLTVLASKRARQLHKGADPLVPTQDKPCVAALREIAAGKVTWDREIEELIQEEIDNKPKYK